MINITLKEFQERAVDFLYDATTYAGKNKKIVLHAPTGSGKTIILIGYIEKYLNNINDTVFVWITPGKGELEEQSKEKMERFSPNSKTASLNEALTSGFDAGICYFINWERITKTGNLAISESEQANLFERIKKAHRNNCRFVLIIDEEHLNNTAKAQTIITALSADYEIRVSATPLKHNIQNYYQIDEIDVIAEGLITRAMYINYNLDTLNVHSIDGETEVLLEKANEVRQNIAKAYENENENIRPLVLIQFPNMNDELIDRVEKKLNDMGYTYENKLLASWFSAETSEEKTSKKLGKINIGTIGANNDITNNNAKPLFLLFKQALATGWDCPRAKVLVKLRENMSENFSIQTLGRLRRMPKATHYGNELLDCSYLYTFDEKYKDAAINMGAYETQRVFLKDSAKLIKLVKEVADKNSNHTDERMIRDKLYEFFRDKYSLKKDKNLNKSLLENNGYVFGDSIKGSLLSGRIVRTRDIVNEEDLKIIETQYDVNTHIHGIELQHNIDILKNLLGLDYTNTRKILEIIFRRDVGNSNYKLLNLTLKEFYSFIINNIEALQHELVDFNALAFSYQNAMRFNKIMDFTIPLEENYKYISETKDVYILQKNVYNEYVSSMIAGKLRSTSERLFEKYAETNDNISDIYKNGDSGINYLSIVYSMNNGIKRHFYPDYIVKKNDGSIWLIETKGGEIERVSKNIDTQVVNKFNEFKRFANEQNYNFAFVRDIDGELFYNNTEYTENMGNAHWKPIREIL